MSETVSTLDKDNKKEGVGEFVRKTREEMTRVSFPSREDVRKTTIIVLIAVLFFATYLFLVDQAWLYFLEGVTWVSNKIAEVF